MYGHGRMIIKHVFSSTIQFKFPTSIFRSILHTITVKNSRALADVEKKIRLKPRLPLRFGRLNLTVELLKKILQLL
jgi:hypothetical protein